MYSCLNVCAAGAIEGYRRWEDEHHFINKDYSIIIFNL